MTVHEELENLRQRIEDLERRNAYTLGVVQECARQLTEATQIGRMIAEELAETQKSLMVVINRAIASN